MLMIKRAHMQSRLIDAFGLIWIFAILNANDKMLVPAENI